jgi:predicted transcriptional regulator of viral defense system
MITTASPVDADLLRLRHEYISAPKLCLTVAQVARLLSVRIDHATAILTTLEEESWLTRTPTGLYRRGESLPKVTA